MAKKLPLIEVEELSLEEVMQLLESETESPTNNHKDDKKQLPNEYAWFENLLRTGTAG
jgi:hypothetical protein